ncbi:MAG TPA: IPT/TIG domain-containing protein [Bryobacteraceae bacterium]
MAEPSPIIEVALVDESNDYGLFITVWIEIREPEQPRPRLAGFGRVRFGLGCTVSGGHTRERYCAAVGTLYLGAERIWKSSDFVGTKLPTTLEGATVTFNDIPAAIYYVRPTQLNVQVPDGLPNGGVTVKVTTSNGSVTAGVQHATVAPGLFISTQLKANDGTIYYYPAAVHTDGTLVGRDFIIAGSRPVVAGETILVFGTGYGPSIPPQPSGLLVNASPLGGLVTVSMAGNRALVQSATLVSPGLYQFNMIVPLGLNSGFDYAMQIGFLGGAQSQVGIYLPIQ